MLWSHVSNELEKRGREEGTYGAGGAAAALAFTGAGGLASGAVARTHCCLVWELGWLVVVLCCVVLCCVKMFVSLVIERTDRGRERGPLYRELVVTPSSREGSLMRDRRAGSE